MPTSLEDYLGSNPYPGRGILMGRSTDGMRGIMAYFIMGRSANSRNRVFTPRDGGIITEAADPAKLEDASLILYAPVRRLGEATIVTNGDQTDTIYDALAAGDSFETALRSRTFEPDAPNFTPRISGLFSLGFGGFSYQLSILKSEGEGRAVRRFFFDYPNPLPGEGHLIHTYAGNGTPLPPFGGEPVRLSVDGTAEALAQRLWNSLNADNRISLFVRTLTLEGEEDTRIYNRYDKV